MARSNFARWPRSKLTTTWAMTVCPHTGYSNIIVVNEDFVHHISEKLDLSGVAPLLCAGITTYSPLKSWNLAKGHKLAVVGLGGLVHMAAKFGNALAPEVTVLLINALNAHEQHSFESLLSPAWVFFNRLCGVRYFTFIASIIEITQFYAEFSQNIGPGTLSNFSWERTVTLLKR